MSTLPIRSVVLYKHGVGYFEREGQVHGAEPVVLGFKQRDVSDVLKSLTVLDLDGGVVSAVGYDSAAPLARLLADIALDIPDEGSLVGLLPQLKGARVAIRERGGSEPSHGAILGIDRLDRETPGGTASQFRLSVLGDSAEVRTYDLFDVDVQLLDDGLKRDLEFYLKTQLASKKKDNRTFTLRPQGEGSRRLRVRYVVEAPVWKATYRLLLNEPGRGEVPLIQGWAVVDNTSDEDWDEIELKLVAGLPVSFVHDLDTPRYIQRPVVEVKETAGVMPPIAEAGYGEAMAFDAPEADMLLMALPAPMMAKSRESARKLAAPQSSVSSVATQTRERQIGDLFEYAIDRPVTVRRNQSALVPIVLKPFAGRSVLLYQKQARAENPMRCVEFENTTGLTLEGGPVTVLDAGSYVGEAMLETLKPGERRLLGYAVELAVRATDSIDSHQSAVSNIAIHRGVLTAYTGNVNETTYTFRSNADRPQVLYIDHPRPHGWELRDTAKPHEVTDRFWRFKIELPPNATTAFTATMEQPTSVGYGLWNTDDATLARWHSDRWIDAATHKLLVSLFAQRRALSDLDAAIQHYEAERQKLHAEQARIRENLTALGDRTSEKELRERYIRTLTAQEDRLEAIDRDRAATQAKRDALQTDLNAKFAGISAERTV